MFNLNYFTMKKNTLLIGALALFATGPVLAQDLVIETMKGKMLSLILFMAMLGRQAI